ncbi:MAG TPA: glutamate racemase, partial [Pyrinomonadaceae bacterium]|nr:glutamate racemase [Pyrinomonadaceae bacterium]
MDRNLPIGIFDSGVGGLTVYRALHARMPAERYVYLGDTARVPYGTKSLSTVERYAVENARFLEARGIKVLVVACNTASALALPAVRRAVSVPVVGMIEPGARAVVNAATGESTGAPSGAGRVGVVATESTVKSGAYSKAIRELAPGLEVHERACPLFVSLAEEGWADSDVARAVAEEYLSELRGKNPGAVVLGCTHYP